MILFAALIGVCMGSFGNVLIDRFPKGETILGRSRCDSCGRTLAVYELIPLVSWLVLRGRCRTCHASITARLPLVEALSGVLAAYAFMHMNGDVVQALPFFVALWALVLIAVIDTRTSTIPDSLIVVVAIAAGILQWMNTGTLPIAAVAIGAGFFALQWILSRGRWVGTGDILLAGAIALLLGSVTAVVWMLLLSYIVGAVIALLLLATKRLHRGAMVPFGPFLVLAAFLVLLLGERLPPLPF